MAWLLFLDREWPRPQVRRTMARRGRLVQDLNDLTDGLRSSRALYGDRELRRSR